MDLRKKLDNFLPRRLTPLVAIIVHLGDNDMVALGCKDLYELIISMFGRLANRFPKAMICSSKIVPRSQWRGAESVQAINNSVKRLNKKCVRLLIISRLSSIPHGCISSDCFFGQNGVHLTPEDNAMLVGNWLAWLNNMMWGGR